jgi:uncharacterized integral membrane protein
MIYATTLVFPIVAIVAGVAVVGALIKFVVEIHRDIRGPRVP